MMAALMHLTRANASKYDTAHQSPNELNKAKATMDAALAKCTGLISASDFESAREIEILVNLPVSPIDCK
jgi:hypothetical protein